MPWSIENCACEGNEGRTFGALKLLLSMLAKEGSEETEDGVKPCKGAGAAGVKLKESN
jgi:hypothetical protein